MSILSVTAVALLAERIVRTHGPITTSDLALHLAEHYGVDHGRVTAGITRALDNERIHHNFIDDHLRPEAADTTHAPHAA